MNRALLAAAGLGLVTGWTLVLAASGAASASVAASSAKNFKRMRLLFPRRL